MKTINKFFISVFLILIIFIARDDINTALNHGALYIENHIGGVKNIKESTSKKDKIVSSDANVSKPITKVQSQDNTPPPLKALSDLINMDSTIKLSQKNVIDLTNKERFANGGLKPLKENYKLDLSAEMKLKDMFTKQYFEHISPSGVGVSDLAVQVSYDYIIIGENLAFGGFKDDKALVDAWMASPGHRANILNKHYSEIGVAVGHGTYEGHDVWMAVQHFGLPKNTCPSTDEALHGSISISQKNAQSMEADLKIRKQNIDSGAVYDGMTTNEQIEKYNEIIKTYNELILNIKHKITDYNNEVKAFNDCVSVNTTS